MDVEDLLSINYQPQKEKPEQANEKHPNHTKNRKMINIKHFSVKKWGWNMKKGALYNIIYHTVHDKSLNKKSCQPVSEAWGTCKQRNKLL